MNKFSLRKKLKNTKGITLIALVVTIIILLILAGVSIAMLTGNNGILTQGKRAKEETEIAEEKEAISLAMNALKIQKQVGAKKSGIKVALNNEPKEEVLDAQSKDVIKLSATSTNSIIITPEELKEEMDKGNPKPESVTQGDDDGLEVTFGADRKNRAYDVTQAGVITKKAQLTPEEAAKIVDIVTNIDGVTYVLTAGGEVKATSVTPGNIFGTLKTTDEVITKNGVKKKNEDWFIDKKGKVYTWGSNGSGQLGDGTTNDSNTPICISDIKGSPLSGKNIVDIYGGSTMIARDSDGKLYSWGYNSDGQLGNGTTVNSSMPICISDIENSPLSGKDIVDVYKISEVVIAKDSSGKLYSWGENYSGQLGNGRTENSSMPVCISDIKESPLKGKNIVNIYVDFSTMIAKDSDGKLYSWGYNGYGQLGDGTTTNSSMPICISDIESNPLKGKKIVDVHNYGSTIIAKDSNGKLYTWGENDYGQLGDETTTDSSMPICISDIENSPLKGKNIVNIYWNDRTIIAKDSSGKLYSWGRNKFGQLGNGTTENSSMPICISDMENSPLNGKDIVDVYADYTIIAKDSNGKLYSWGDNDSGKLGNGTTTNSSMPICISEVEGSPLKEKNIVKIYRGDDTIIAKDSDGKLYSWGSNGDGQLGDGTRNNSNIPICISDIENSELKNKKIKNVEYEYGGNTYYCYITVSGELYRYFYVRDM